MEYKDSLEIYDELLAAGTPEAQARIQAHQFGNIDKVLERLEYKFDKFQTIIYIMGGAIFTMVCVPVMGKFL